jgi:ribulose-5-phosphate 4-epimerase/fuculose-1-phosphate aldolase
MSQLVPANPFVERTPDEERTHRKRRLAAAFRIFGRFGFDEGVAGHITARDPERTDHFWVNPFGDVVEGSWPVNRAAFAIHSGIHAARPDVVAAAHSHSKFGRAFSTLGRTLEPLTQDSCIFHDDHVLFDDYTGVVDDPAEGKRIAHSLGGAKAAILVNHGLLTVGKSVDEALFWFVTMERTCEVELLARAAGEPRLIAPDVARATHDQVGSDLAGWFSAQPLFDWIEAAEPDLVG